MIMMIKGGGGAVVEGFDILMKGGGCSGWVVGWVTMTTKRVIEIERGGGFEGEDGK